MIEPRTGNAVVGQAGGPTAVINQSLAGIIEECQKYRHIRRVLGARHGVRGILKEQFYDLNRQPTNMVDLVAQTPAAAFGATRDRPDHEYCERIFEVFRKLDVRYFFYIGGNDSAETAHIINKLSADAKFDMRIIHVPKTIDNDLLVTDHCPGYGSAARFVASAFIGDDLDNRALPGVKINILMGRNAGFLTAASILARQRADDGPHLVYLPERPFDVDRFVNDVREVYERLGRCLVAISEGIRHESGQLWAEKVSVLQQSALEKDAFGNLQLSAGAGSMADYLAGTLRNRFKEIRRVRADSFGYLQRSFAGCASDVDQWEAPPGGPDGGQLFARRRDQRERRPCAPAQHDLHHRHEARRPSATSPRTTPPRPGKCPPITSTKPGTTWTTASANTPPRSWATCRESAGLSRSCSYEATQLASHSASGRSPARRGGGRRALGGEEERSGRQAAGEDPGL